MDEARALQSEWFELWDLLSFVEHRQACVAMFLGLGGRPRKAPPRSWEGLFDEYLAETLPRVQRTRLDAARFKRLLRAYCGSLKAHRLPTYSLERFVKQRMKAVLEQLGRVPASTAKCEGFLHCTLSRDPQMEVLSYFDSRGMTLDPRGVTYWVNLRNEDRLPTASLGRETMLSTIEYEFFSRFDPTPSQTFLRKLEICVRRSITEWRAYVGEWRLEGLNVDFRSLLCTLWLCARVPALRQAVADEARKAMLDVVSCQNADGSWHEMSHSTANFEKEIHSPFATALAVCCIQDYLPESSNGAKQAQTAVGWLCRVQQADGSWPDLEEGKAGDYWTTLAALGALKNSTAGDLERYIQAGGRWLLSQQKALGEWQGPFSPHFASVLALEYFHRAKRADLPTDRFTQGAIELFDRANELLRQAHTTYADRALATFAIHHAVEFFLYGVLQSPAVNRNIYQASNQTLGLRMAMSTLQEHLESVGKLKPKQELSYRTQISDLASDRDDIVHKAKDIAVEQLRVHLTTARKFVSKYSATLLGGDIIGR